MIEKINDCLKILIKQFKLKGKENLLRFEVENYFFNLTYQKQIFVVLKRE